MLLSLSTIGLSILLAFIMKALGETDVTFAVGLFIFGFIGLVSSSVSAYKRACPPSKNGHRKASKNRMNRSICSVYERLPHLFHGLLDNEPLPM